VPKPDGAVNRFIARLFSRRLPARSPWLAEADARGLRVVARVRALLPLDWVSKAGDRFRRTTQAISDFAQAHQIRPEDVLNEGVELGRNKIEGLANKEFAEATKNFAEAEQKKIETELQRRSLESKVRREEAEARVAEIKVVDAEIELLKKLRDLAVVLHRDDNGNLTVLPASGDCDITKLLNGPARRTED
jgi:hypothetical protein